VVKVVNCNSYHPAQFCTRVQNGSNKPAGQVRAALLSLIVPRSINDRRNTLIGFG
jgi:hypothetical protein